MVRKMMRFHRIKCLSSPLQGPTLKLAFLLPMLICILVAVVVEGMMVEVMEAAVAAVKRERMI